MFRRHHDRSALSLNPVSPVVLFVGVEDVLVLGAGDELALGAGPHLARSGPRVGGPLVPLEAHLNLVFQTWLPDGYSQIFRSYVFGPLGF